MREPRRKNNVVRILNIRWWSVDFKHVIARLAAGMTATRLVKRQFVMAAASRTAPAIITP